MVQPVLTGSATITGIFNVRKLPVTWGLAVVFAGYSGFLHYLQLASHELATFGINVTKTELQIQIQIRYIYAQETPQIRNG